MSERTKDDKKVLQWFDDMLKGDMPDVSIELADYERNNGDRATSILRDVDAEIHKRQYLVIEKTSEDMGYELPVTASIVKGSELQAEFSLHSLNEAWMESGNNKSLAVVVEVDNGYDAGEKYLMDVSHLNGRGQAALLRNIENGFEELLDAANQTGHGYNRGAGEFTAINNEYRGYEEQEYGRSLEEDSGMYENRSSWGHNITAQDAVNLALEEARDSGAKSPFAAVREAFENAMERYPAVELEAEAANEKASKTAKEDSVNEIKEEPENVMKANQNQQVSPTEIVMEERQEADKKDKPAKKEKGEKVTSANRSGPIQTASNSNVKVKKPNGLSFSTGSPKDWDKAIFIKSGSADIVRDEQGRISQLEVRARESEIPVDGMTDAKVVISLNHKETAKKHGYIAKYLANSPKFRNWGVIEPKQATATFELRGKVDGKDVVVNISISEARDIIQGRNKERDEELTQKKGLESRIQKAVDKVNPERKVSIKNNVTDGNARV